MVLAVRQANQIKRLIGGHGIVGNLGDEVDILVSGQARHQIIELEDEADMVSPVARQLRIRHRRQILVEEVGLAISRAVEPAKDV